MPDRGESGNKQDIFYPNIYKNERIFHHSSEATALMMPEKTIDHVE
jgi:hypothetical protein